MKLHDLFYKLMNEYSNILASVKANSDFKNPFRNIVSEYIPDRISELVTLSDPYQVTGSYGKGRWTDVPWIAIFDQRITTSAQKGVYIVYLLNKDEKTLYLTFEIAATEAIPSRFDSDGKPIFSSIAKKNNEELNDCLSAKVEEIRKKIKSTEFRADNNIHSGSSGYDHGTVYYKKYTLHDLPDDDILSNDLKKMIEIYGRYYEEIHTGNVAQSQEVWEPTLREYTPNLTKADWLRLLNDPKVFTLECLQAMAHYYDMGGAASCMQLSEKYGKSIAFYRTSIGVHLASRIAEATGCPLYDRENSKYWPILFVARKAGSEEAGSYIWKLRDELMEALKEINISQYLSDPEETHALGDFDSWEILSETTAVKNCDKSFFDHHGSGVPKGICWFFGADKLIPGQNGNITLAYEGVEYQGRLANDTTDRRRVRIFWNTELSKLFNLHRAEAHPRAVFHRIADDYFEVSFEKGEEEMVTPSRELSVKDTLSRIKTYIASKGFTYEDGLIENFYLSLKSKPFVILAGTSGTGKTRLVRLFAEAVGATANNGRYKMVPVRPDWSDSSDLFGHMDLNGKFVPGTIIDFVKRAEMDLSRPYFLCLDEMNLARVEYYLSDILSVIETRDFQGSSIVSAPLVDSTYYGSDAAAAGRYGTVLLPENLYIIGTVNMDETTFPFSRKVLDRANTIEFSYVDLIPQQLDPTVTPAPMNLPNSFLKTEYLLLAQCADSQDEVEKYCTELQKINQVLQKANAHVGYRVRDEIVFYLLNNRKAELLDENNAMDNEIMQKILPRIQGSSASVKRMLCELFKICAGDYEGYQVENDDIASKMFKAAQNAKYKKSAEKIAFMVRRYEEDGFTSYWL